MTEQTCSTCRHFRSTTDLTVGECRRFPPTAVPIQNQMGGLAAASMHPPVKRQDGCGEWGGQPLEVTGRIG